MAERWEDEWVKDGPEVRGGQGVSFRVKNRAAPEAQGFVKTLKDPTNPKARGRFYREVAAYETLRDADVPKLLAHNASAWQTSGVPLYMVVEYIAGNNLLEQVKAAGPYPFDEALELIRKLLDAVSLAHELGIVHRDIKPANIMLRDGSFRQPVLVDFGLSFNEGDDSVDLTRVGEEVGNRFLRLPEHLAGSRDAVADVTQLAGIFFYALTGFEPRILIDERGRMPHQREGAREVLQRALIGRPALRLLQVFDKAFAAIASERFQTTEELRAALTLIIAPSAHGAGSLEDLLGQVAEITTGQQFAKTEGQRAQLGVFLNQIRSTVSVFATQRQLQHVQSGWTIAADARVPYASTLLAVFDTQTGQPRDLSEYAVQLVGGEVVFSVAGEAVWRGSDPLDAQLEQAVEYAAAQQYLRTRADAAK